MLGACTDDRDNGVDPPPSGDFSTETGDFGNTGTGTGTGTDTGTDTGGDDGGYDWPDIGTIGECNPLLQDCDDGFKCNAYTDGSGTAWNNTACVEVVGSGVDGSPCVDQGGGVDDCAKGFICLDTGSGSGATCVDFCDGAARACSTGTVCAAYNNGALPLCLPSCDPLLQDCLAGQACIDTPQGQFICFNDASGDQGAAGDTCPDADGENLCDPGLWCGSGAAECATGNCCTPYCNINEAGSCTAPNECVSFYGDASAAPAEYADVGVCIVP